MKILIVEDEIRIREGIEKLLGKFSPKYEIVGRAENGLEGLRLCRECRPDIVITDVKMPQMDGLEMLTALAQDGIAVKAIVLSAYSEFEYARAAMKLGVTEYLLKPIGLGDFAQALKNVEEQICKERQEKPAQVGTLEQIFGDVINGSAAESVEVMNYLKNCYDIRERQSFAIICVYLGSNFEKEAEQTKKQLQYAFSTYPNISYCILNMAYKRSLVMVVYHCRDMHDLERWVQYQILRCSMGHVSIGWVEADDIRNLGRELDCLLPYMDWNISLREDVLISYPKITKVQTVPCIYPIEQESRLKAAICASDELRTKEVVESFHRHFADGRVYHPREVKECYVRFLWLMLSIAKEINCIDYQSIEQQKLLDMIMNAKTADELILISEYLVQKLQFQTLNESTTHLTVRRAQGMIHEFYQTGITLDEIATKLHITPEYLGTQFHKEMGVTFSNYLKNYRIGKAKELLCGTSLKLYEIAERVGYADPKYFSKVFRDTTGQLPADYRKTYN